MSKVVILKFKQLNLSTGEIKEIPANPITLTRVEMLAKLNINPAVYGCVYFIDDSCLKITETKTS